jgi:hypothetical protein
METLAALLCCCGMYLLRTQRICGRHAHQIHRKFKLLASFAPLVILLLVE